MQCPRCCRWSPDDPQTGYSVEELCPDCAKAEDESESLEQSIERLTRAIDAHVERFLRVRETLRTFYLSPISASSLAPVLALAEELNPELRRVDVPIEDHQILRADSSPF